MMGDAAAAGHSEDSDYEVGKHFDLGLEHTRPGPTRTARAAVRLMTSERDTAGPQVCSVRSATCSSAQKPVAA